ASAADLLALEEAIGRPLPADYQALLKHCDGADLRGDRLLPAREAAEHYRTLRTLMTPVFRADPDWHDEAPPDFLVPIGEDLDGNLKCLDLSTSAPEVVDWHRESFSFTTWHQDLGAWLLAAMDQLAVRFDYRGRPRVLRAGTGDPLRRLELEAWIANDPTGPWPLLELAEWTAEYCPPEEALFVYRQASEGQPEMAVAHFEHARFAIAFGRFEEARRQLRRCLAVPADRNPRKHDLRDARRPMAHHLLAALYEAAGYQKKADAQRRLARRASEYPGSDAWEQRPEYRESLERIHDAHTDHERIDQ
ncbi:MAG: hypothetical protein ACI9WU_002600, partial [Myxococcota bacterium]